MATKRTERLDIRLTRKERKLVEKLSKKQGVTYTAAIIEAVRQALESA